jgi:NAD(P)-dependent dehydrogenase (short-subunit alcohol dehydrogenase family)
MKIEGRVVLITGGASGIGESIALQLAKKGAIVYITDIQVEKGLTIEKNSNGGIFFVKCDISDEKSVIEMFSLITNTHKKVDIVINSAGKAYGEPTATEETTHSSDWFEKIWKINTFGTFLISKYGAKSMIDNFDPNNEECNGIIIMISSIAALDGPSSQVAYASSKEAINGMVLPMARDLGKYKIRVNSICPGFIVTPMTNSVPTEQGQKLKDLTPIKSFGKTEDITKTVEYIIDCDFINASQIRVDGGVRLPPYNY